MDHECGGSAHARPDAAVGILLSSALLIAIPIAGDTPGLQIYNGPNGPRWISSKPADGLQPFFWALLAAAVRPCSTAALTWQVVAVFLGANLALCESIGSCHAKGAVAACRLS